MEASPGAPLMSDSDMDESDSSTYFAVAAVHETLGRSTGVDSCTALSARIAGMLGQALDYFRNETAVACQAGCSFCCHLRIMVYPHEAIALFRYLGTRMDEEQAAGVRQRLFANAQQLTRQKSGEAPRAHACAFLVDGRCSAYEVRPAACAGHHSLSRQRCEEAYEHDGLSPPEKGIPVSLAIDRVASTMKEGLDQGIAAIGLSAGLVELQTAVAALVRNPGLIAKWRTGGAWKRDARGCVRPN